jgi:dihydrofolate reductase
MLQQGLIDEIILSIIPVQLQRGTLLFAGGVVTDGFECKATTAFATGLIQHVYGLKKQDDQ